MNFMTSGIFTWALVCITIPEPTVPTSSVPRVTQSVPRNVIPEPTELPRIFVPGPRLSSDNFTVPTSPHIEQHVQLTISPLDVRST